MKPLFVKTMVGWINLSNVAAIDPYGGSITFTGGVSIDVDSSELKPLLNRLQEVHPELFLNT
jgi:hypothetical protein